jgi:hypothetical protein
MNYTIYTVATGVIQKIVSGNAGFAALNAGAGENYIAGSYDDELYWINTSTSLPELRTDYTIDTLPIPCTAYIEDIEYSITSSPTFEFDAPGDYEIEIDAGPSYLRKVFIVSNT